MGENEIVPVPADCGPLTLWYCEAAEQWVEALPVGNGRLGGMVFGGVAGERIQFNEDTVWKGKPHDYAHEGAVEHLPELHRLMAAMLAEERQGRWEEARKLQLEAQELALAEFMSQPLGQTGDLRIDFEHGSEAESYVRWLDLDRAVAGVDYRCGGVNFARRVFASFPDRAIVVSLRADRPGALGFRARLSSPHGDTRVACVDGDLLLSGRVEEGGIRLAARLQVRTDGEVAEAEEGIAVGGAGRAELYLVAASSYVDYQDIGGDPEAGCARDCAALEGGSYEVIEADHVADHRALFRRVTLDLGGVAESGRSTLERLAREGRKKDR